MGKWSKLATGELTYTHHGVVIDDTTLKQIFAVMLAGGSRRQVAKHFGLRLKAVREIERKFREWMR